MCRGIIENPQMKWFENSLCIITDTDEIMCKPVFKIITMQSGGRKKLEICSPLGQLSSYG